MENEKTDIVDPYRLLFPLGLFLGTFGVFYWILFDFKILKFYPREIHSQTMFFGFLWTFVAGFLMTAIPRMTKSVQATWFEMGLAGFLTLLQLVLGLRHMSEALDYIFILQTLFLIYFAGRRFLAHKRIPFEGFIFIPFAFLIVFVGFGLKYFQVISQNDYIRLAGEGFILNLIFGVGARLIPVLSRLPRALMPDQQSSLGRIKEFVIIALLINLVFILEVLYRNQWLSLFKFSIFTFYAIRYLGLLTKPTRWSVLAVGLKIGILSVLKGTLLVAWPQYFSMTASLHIIYIGGFSLITLMIASRVMLAHGGQSTDYELRSRLLISVIVFLLLSASFRYFAGVAVGGFLITAAVICFLVAIAIWGYKFFKILLDLHKL